MSVRAAIGLLSITLLAAVVACAPGRSSDGAAGSGMVSAPASADATGAALVQRLADFETALGMLRPVHWVLRDIEWDARCDDRRVYYVRQRLHSGDGGSADEEYFYEAERLFAYRASMTHVRVTGRHPIDQVITLAFFDPRGGLLHIRSTADGRLLRMNGGEQEWLRAHTLEVANAVLDDAHKHLARH